MIKKSKFTPLKVGQRVWIEMIPMFFKRESTLNEYEVVRVNKSSAYVVRVEDVSKESPLERRINQSNGKVYSGYSAGYDYRLWHSKEIFELAKEMLEEKLKLRQEAIAKVNQMTLNELREFLNDEGDI